MMYLKKYKNVYWFDFIFLKETLCFYELFIYTFKGIRVGLGYKFIRWRNLINMVNGKKKLSCENFKFFAQKMSEPSIFVKKMLNFYRVIFFSPFTN